MASLWPQLLVKFVLGGIAVSLFALLGEVLRPRSFSGLFGAAPSVAVTTLALAYAQGGCSLVATLSRSMVLGGAALCVYGLACAGLARRSALPVWAAAGLCWLLWLGVALGGWRAGVALGVLR